MQVGEPLTMDLIALADAENKLDLYILDYLRRRNLFNTARTFLEEKNVDTNVEIIEAPQGLLYEWWSIFWNSSSGRTEENQPHAASSCQEENAREQHMQLDMNSPFMHAQVQVQQTDVLHADLHGSPNAILDSGTQQGRTGNPAQMYSQLSSQVPGSSRVHLPISTVHDLRPLNIAALQYMQQQNQPPASNFRLDFFLHNLATMQATYAAGETRIAGLVNATMSDPYLVNHHQLVQPNRQHVSTEAAQQENILGANHSNSSTQGVRRLCAHSLEGAQGTDDLIQANPIPPQDDGVIPEDHETEGINTLNGSGKKLVCCDFSSDGKLLAAAGNVNTVFLWNLDNPSENSAWEAHSGFITDIRFRPNTSMLATSSSDKTVQLWNATERYGSLQTFVGHSSKVTSVDFHPTITERVCSSDDDGKIIFWNVGESNPKHISKVIGGGKVRFQPSGRHLASSAQSIVNIIHIETDKIVRRLKGDSNNNVIQSVCWHTNSLQLATVTEDCVKLWSIDGHCICELNANQNPFRSCTFVPNSQALVMGAYQSLTLWDFFHNKIVSVLAHENYITSLGMCRATRLVASVSHDGIVKTWRYNPSRLLM